MKSISTILSDKLSFLKEKFVLPQYFRCFSLDKVSLLFAHKIFKIILFILKEIPSCSVYLNIFCLKFNWY